MLYVMKDTVSSTLLPNSAAPPAQLTISIYQHMTSCMTMSVCVWQSRHDTDTGLASAGVTCRCEGLW